MAGKYGRRNVVSEDISKYSICLLGEGGIGKTTLLYNVTNKLLGDEGTMFLELGKEQGADAIDGIMYEDVPTWKKFKEIVDDITHNKNTDYPNLKLIVLDTLDQAIDLATNETIRLWNAQNMGNPNFKKVSTLNGAFGGFGAGMDYCTNLILEEMWKLKRVGVNVWIVGHIKVRSVIDSVTGGEYSTLTTDVAQRMFNEFKNKMHIVAIAYIDRKVETVGTGRKNIVNHKEITMNKVSEEVRRISFRDESNYIIDSKSRFKDIVPNIPMDADEFIKAIQDAIKAEKNSSKSISVSTPAPKIEVAHTDEEYEEDPEIAAMEEQEDMAEDLEADVENAQQEEDDDYPEDLRNVVKDMIKSADEDQKKEAKAIVKQFGTFKAVTDDGLKTLYDLLK